MELRREYTDVATEGRYLFQECRDVFIAESVKLQDSTQKTMATSLDGQALIDELETKVHEGFRGLTDDRTAA